MKFCGMKKQLAFAAANAKANIRFTNTYGSHHHGGPNAVTPFESLVLQ
jgi:hypothetical protein